MAGTARKPRAGVLAAYPGKVPRMDLEMVDPDDVERLMLHTELPPADEVRARAIANAPARDLAHWEALARDGGVSGIVAPEPDDGGKEHPETGSSDVEVIKPERVTPATEDRLEPDRTDDGPGAPG